jgi:hypothetical protein
MDSSDAQDFCTEVVECDDSLRAAAIANDVGSMIALYYKRGIMPLLSREESERYSIAAVIRAMTHEMFASKIGNMRYAIVVHEKIIQVTIPVTYDQKKKFFLLVGFNVGSNFVEVVENKIVPLVKKNRQYFL